MYVLQGSLKSLPTESAEHGHFSQNIYKGDNYYRVLIDYESNKGSEHKNIIVKDLEKFYSSRRVPFR